MGTFDWVSKVMAALARAWSQYRPEHQFVILRHAETELHALGTQQELSATGKQQLAEAARLIRDHYGADVKFHVFAVNSSISLPAWESAERLCSLLQPEAVDLTSRWVLLKEFLDKVWLTPGVIPVIVSIEPVVERLLLKVYGSDWTNGDIMSIDITARHGVPHFFRLVQAKHPDITLPAHKVVADAG